jgi:hypothetical protein
MNRTTELSRIKKLFQIDVCKRGLALDPTENLFTICAGDFAEACVDLVTNGKSIGLVTGFYIADASPPAFETDGPPGAVALAAFLRSAGRSVHIFMPPQLENAFAVGLPFFGLIPGRDIQLTTIDSTRLSLMAQARLADLTHLIFIESVGPAADGRCYSMRGRDITETLTPGYWLYQQLDATKRPALIGIGDGGNEIGMGKIPASVVSRNIPLSDRSRCRMETHYIIVAALRNWVAIGLGAGFALAGGVLIPNHWFEERHQRQFLRAMTEAGGLVDGVTCEAQPTVDGLSWESYRHIFAGLSTIEELGE